MPAEPLDLDDEEDVNPTLIRRQQLRTKARRRTLLLAAGLGLVVLVTAAVLLGRTRSGTHPGGVSGPGLLGPSTSDSDRWTMTELKDYLISKGVKIRRMVPYRSEVLFVFAPDETEADHAVLLFRDAKTADSRIITIERMGSAEAARQYAGIDPEVRLAWGQIIFEGYRDPGIKSPKYAQENLDQISRALLGRPFPSR